MMAGKTGKPPRHGDIRVSNLSLKSARKHLSTMTAHASQVADYHHGVPNTARDFGAGDIGQSSRGGFSGSGMSGGAAGADYETTSVGSTPDADSTGSTGY
jgi:hypothetical protein